MPFDDDAEELPGFHPPPHPDDRIWRHPSELRAYPIVPLGAPGRPPRRWVAAGGRRPWFALVAAGTAGAVLAGVAVITLGVGERVVDRPVTERVALDPVAAAPGLAGTSVRDIRRLVTPGVVAIGGPVSSDPRGTGRALRGSGVVLRDDGIVVTSAALLTRGDVWARLPDGTAVRGDVVGSDPMTGLGLLDLRGSGYTPSVRARIGDLVAGEMSYGVTARPGGGTVTAPGTVGRAARYVGPMGSALDGIAVGGTPARLALGGALADPRGAVVGITTAIEEDDGGGWFVMPIEAVDKVADDLLADGTVHGCWLGIEGADTPDPSTPDSTSGGGTSVTSVIENSPAALGGLDVGDVVLGLDERPVTRMPDLNVALRSHSPGDRVDLDVARPDGSRVTLVITLGAAPASRR